MALSFSARAQDTIGYSYDLPDTMYSVRNAVKFDPVQVFFGDYQFYFERMVGDQWSVEVGLGPTRRNFTASLFEYELDNFGNNIDIKTRYAASLWLRRYFWDTGELYGPYLAAAVIHRRHDKTYNVINVEGDLSGISFDDSRRYTSFMLFAGYQAIPMQSNLFCDFYLGLGARYRDFDIVRSNDIYSPDDYIVNQEQSWIGTIQVGVKVGYGF